MTDWKGKPQEKTFLIRCSSFAVLMSEAKKAAKAAGEAGNCGSAKAGGEAPKAKGEPCACSLGGEA